MVPADIRQLFFLNAQTPYLDPCGYKSFVSMVIFRKRSHSMQAGKIKKTGYENDINSISEIVYGNTVTVNSVNCGFWQSVKVISAKQRSTFAHNKKKKS